MKSGFGLHVAETGGVQELLGHFQHFVVLDEIHRQRHQPTPAVGVDRWLEVAVLPDVLDLQDAAFESLADRTDAIIACGSPLHLTRRVDGNRPIGERDWVSIGRRL